MGMPDGIRADRAWDRASLMALFDRERGVLDRRVLSDESLYRLELERIFARGWNFMCHESQIPNPGDYFINYIGEDQVIVVRDETGRVNVLLNTCRHRGNALCRAEQGRAKSFVCSYHGWNYGLDGSLIGVPGIKNYYRDDLDRSRLGLVKAAQVDAYLGFYFATVAPDAVKPAGVPFRLASSNLQSAVANASALSELVPSVLRWISSEKELPSSWVRRFMPCVRFR